MGQAAMEAETVIRFDEEGNEAIIYTASIRVAKWMMKQAEPKRIFRDTKGNETGWEFEVPKRCVRFKNGKNRMLYLGGR